MRLAARYLLFFSVLYSTLSGQTLPTPPIQIPSDFVCSQYAILLLRFESIPAPEARQYMHSLGFEWLYYAGDNRYLALVPWDFPESLGALGIIDFIPWRLYDSQPAHLWENEAGLFTFKYLKKFETDAIRIAYMYSPLPPAMDPDNAMMTLFLRAGELKQLVQYPHFLSVESAAVRVEPEDERGRSFLRSNLLHSSLPAGLQLDGQGFAVAIGDDGPVGPHIDFQNRVQHTGIPEDIDGIHGDQMAGILGGAGNLDPTITGIVPAAQLIVTHHFDAVKDALTLREHYGVSITCTSLADGCNRGYTSLSMTTDEQMSTYPDLLHVFSAGNAGQQDCLYGAGPGWGNITGGVKMAKNGMVVGNVSPDDQLISTSSKGPATDGRIKPDVVANGADQISTLPGNEYAATGGTSAAAPGVAGVAAQLGQAYKMFHPDAVPPSALIKAALLNTAEDLGNPGPDFSFGFGRINAIKAFETLKFDHFWSGTIENGGLKNFVLNVPAGSTRLKVMLYWHDAPALPTSQVALVNDLDLKMITPSGEIHLPWILNASPDPALLQLPALKGADHLNNAEQITVDNPDPGSYVINVQGFAVAMGWQDYYVVYEIEQPGIRLTYPVGGEYLAPGDIQRIYWDACYTGNEPVTIELSQDFGLSWNPIAVVATGVQFYDWHIPSEIPPGKGLIRLTSGIYTSQSQHFFDIYSPPDHFSVAKACPDHLILKWSPVSGAIGYQLYRMGPQYMEPIQMVTDTFERIDITDPTLENWFAVQAIGANGVKSRRSIAIRTEGNIFNCVPDADIGIWSIAAPAGSLIKYCYADSMEVAVNIQNFGNHYIPAFEIHYQLDDLPVQTQYYAGGLPAGTIIQLPFVAMLPPMDPGEHQLRVWTSLSEDEANYNDTLSKIFNVLISELYHPPYIENFDQFQIQCTSPGCHDAFELSKGWLNETNLDQDMNDWRIVNGTCEMTYPHSDQNSNLTTGAFLHIETGVSCGDAYAELLSPCFDLTGTEAPTLHFWYHMTGDENNLLYLDLYNGTQWLTLQYFAGITDQWQLAEIPLTAFQSSTVLLRFRAKPGPDGAGISLDNISIIEAHYPPIAAFTADSWLTCSGDPVAFHDNSYNDPQTWSWSFNPPDVIFAMGTSAASPDPVVLFQHPGAYEISLAVSNAYGSHQIVADSFLYVYDGLTLPVIQSFDDDANSWMLINPDQETGWSPAIVPGIAGDLTHALYMDYHSYNAPGQLDMMVSPVIDLTSAFQPTLQFDWSYVAYNQQNVDRLRILLSDDCGESFGHVLFDASGSALATAPFQQSAWSPSSVFHWQTQRLDLSDFTGRNIILKWESTNGFGNNLYIDNIQLAEATAFPSVETVHIPGPLCQGESAVFWATSDMLSENGFSWNFSEGADPGMINSNDTAIVQCLDFGSYEAQLLLQYQGMHTIYRWEWLVQPLPVAGFDYTVGENEITCINYSKEASWFRWEFSNGMTSSLKDPVISWEDGAYPTWVTLFAFNACGADTMTLPIITPIQDIQPNQGVALSPNPANDFCTLRFDPAFTGNDILMTIYNASGASLEQHRIPSVSGHMYEWDVSHLPAAVYYLRVAQQDLVIPVKLIIAR